MTHHETDYLVIGAGAVGLAFVDTLLDEDPDCHITIIDKHAAPGGHWNDAYSFVALHQPSSVYGVNSMELCSGKVDKQGHNAGYYPLAKHSKILAYYSELMNERLIPSKRVAYHPMCEFVYDETGQHRAKGILSGEEHSFTVRRKLVDGTWYKTSVPSTHKPPFDIAEDARFAIPGDLPKLWKDPANLPKHFAIIGGGKTAADTAVWLLESGVSADRIDWVRPRDSWYFNRRYMQPAHADLEGLVKLQLDQVECAASSQTGDEMFEKLGERGTMLRIDEDVKPEMFHFAVISRGEIKLLRQITRLHRGKHVSALSKDKMHFGDECVSMPQDTLFIDCTASAVTPGAVKRTEPIFQKDRIVLQMAQAPLIPYSAALIGFIEANFDDDMEKNALIPPAPLTDTPNTYPYVLMANLMSTGILSANAKTSAFNAKSRLHPTGPTIDKLMKIGDPRLAKLAHVGPTIQKNMPDVIKLGMAAKALHEDEMGIV